MKQKLVTLLECVFNSDPELKEFGKKMLPEETRKIAETAILQKDIEALLKLCGSDSKKICTYLIKGKSRSLSIESIIALNSDTSAFLQKKAREQLCLTYKNYVSFLMETRFSSYLPQYKYDLYKCGIAGLYKAFDTYTPGAFTFTAYSKFYIIHEMTQFVHSLAKPLHAYYFQMAH